MDLIIRYYSWESNGTRYAMSVNDKEYALDECGDAGYFYTSAYDAKVQARWLLQLHYNVVVEVDDIKFDIL